MIPQKQQKEIERQCDEWLKPMNYSCGCISGNCLIYTSNNPSADWPWPSIRCYFNENNQIDVILVMSNRKTLIKAEIGPIQFKHPDIKEFISQLRYLANCCDSMFTNNLAEWHVNNLLQELEG